MTGKGDNPRPLSVSPEQFAERFDAIDWTRRAREQSQRDAICTGSGFLHMDPSAKVSSNQVNAIAPDDVYVHFWGSFDLRGRWHPNPNLTLSDQEQYDQMLAAGQITPEGRRP